MCKTCINVIDFFKFALTSDKAVSVAKFVFYKYCIRDKTEEYCSLFAENNVAHVYKAAFSIINSDELCTKGLFCNDVKYIEDSLQDFIKRTFHDRPPLDNYTQTLYNPDNLVKILVVTDTHIDHEYKEGKSAVCGNSICCRKDSPDTNITRDKAGKFGFLGRCDLPLVTAESFVEYALNNSKPDAVFFLGDNPAHNGWEQVPGTHLDGLREVSKLLERFNVTVYPTLGNHEGYPADNFDVNPKGSHQWIINQSLAAWSKWFTKDMEETYRRNGCYSDIIKGTNVKVISVSPFVMLVGNLYLWGNQTDPLGVLEWIRSELNSSEAKGEHVIIIGHVPPFSPPFDTRWAQRFYILIERYANIIKGLIYGHVHSDYFAMVKGIKNDPVSVVHTCPSLTTESYKNPTYRVYELDRNTNTLIDYVQYSMKLKDSNTKGKAIWGKSYRFTSYFGVPDLSVKSYGLLLDKIRNDRTVRQKAFWVKYQEGPVGNQTFNNATRSKIAMCDYESSTVKERARCTNATFWSITDCFSYGFIPMPCRRWERRIDINH